MRCAAVAGLLATLAGAVAAQEAELATAAGAVLRGLDKVNAEVTEIEIASGGSVGFGGLTVRLADCRYPADDPAGEAYAFVTVRDDKSGANLFSGWMIASSPALNALEHPHYDIWVLRCKTD